MHSYGHLRDFFKIVAAIAAAAFLYSCASIGNPSGGPVDETPPRFVRANPAPGSTDVDRHTVTIDFDELVNVKDAFSKVVVSPPSKQTARVSSNGRRVTVQLPDTLLPNTTYTIDFGNAIEDVNEGNKLEGFSYTFSTGPELDSMRVSGIVLDAATLEPQKEVLVGVHSILADSAFTSLPFERLAKTDDRGRFIIRGMKPGPYRIFALGDLNNDYRWDNPEENIAFYDQIIAPQAEQTEVIDTIYNLKTAEIDTIMTRRRTRYLPNDILLSMFNIGFKQQYPVTTERIDSTRLRLIFNARSTFPARLSPIDIAHDDDWFDLERNADNDTVVYWLRDPRLVAADTLRMQMTFEKILRDGSSAIQTDTVEFVTARPRAIPKKKEKKEATTDADTPKLLGLRVLSQSSLDIDAPLVIEADQPLESFYRDAIHLDKKVDSLWTVAPNFNGAVLDDSLSIRRYRIDPQWEYDTEYRLRIDSLAAKSIYGLSNRASEHTFRIKKENDYCRFVFSITGLPQGVPAFVELLNGSDAPVREAPVVNGSAVFNNLLPATYYARLTVDANGNGKFDTGNYDSGLQPEQVFYYPKRLPLKKGWDTGQTWDILDTPADMQKPEAIKKNKPDSDRRAKKKQPTPTEDDDEELFDPTRNPFDPNDRGRRRTTAGSY